MADFEYSVDGAIATMRFNRPEKLNAITYEMLGLIEDATKRAGSDPAVRAVVLTGAGRAFSAGTDLQQLSQQAPTTARAELLAQAYADDRPGPWTFASIAKPTIAAVNGAAVGLGAEFTLQCDLRLAAESARWGWVFVHRGLVPDTAAGTWLLPRVVGLQRAAELLFTGEIIDSQRAVDIGLALERIPDADLMGRAMDLAHRVAKGAPLATAQTKKLLYRGLARDAGDHVRASSEALTGLFASEDFKEGVRAFIEHRDPDWKGN